MAQSAGSWEAASTIAKDLNASEDPKPECDEYIRIFEYSNIFDPNIYSGIRSYHF